MQQIDNKMLPNSRASALVSELYLFPEQAPYLHFHGLLFVLKASRKKFETMCVEKIEDEDSEALKKPFKSVRLLDKITKPYSTKAYEINKIRKIRRNKRTPEQNTLLFNSPPIITVSDYRIHQLSSYDDALRFYKYSVKDFVASEYGIDNLIIIKKDNPRPFREQQRSEHKMRQERANLVNNVHV